MKNSIINNQPNNQQGNILQSVQNFNPEDFINILNFFYTKPEDQEKIKTAFSVLGEISKKIPNNQQVQQINVESSEISNTDNQNLEENPLLNKTSNIINKTASCLKIDSKQVAELLKKNIEAGTFDFVLLKIIEFEFISTGINAIDLFIDINKKNIYFHFWIGFKSFFSLTGLKSFFSNGENHYYYAMMNFLYLILIPISFIYLNNKKWIKILCLSLLSLGLLLIFLSFFKFKYNSNIKHLGILISSIGMLFGTKITICLQLTIMICNFLFFNKYFVKNNKSENQYTSTILLEKAIVKRLKELINQKSESEQEVKKSESFFSFKYAQEVLFFFCSAAAIFFAITNKNYNFKIVLIIAGFVTLFVIISCLLFYIGMMPTNKTINI